MASLAAHTLPNIADGEAPFSRLLDPRWSDVLLHHLKDSEDYLQKRKTLGKKTSDDTAADHPKPKSKAKAKARPEPATDA